MDLTECRKKIDNIDDQLLDLFMQRMDIVTKVAEYKKQNGMAIFHKGREREILQRLSEKSGEELEDYVRILYSVMMDLSRSYQNKKISDKAGELAQKINTALENTPKLFPKKGVVACQGIEGANSQIACDRLFANANILYVKNFEGVFNAVEQGLCKYGILPIENSLYGTVTQVYDLMKNYKFHIVKSMKIKINHVIMAKPGVKFSQIKEIFSHEQAIGQCSEFLKKYPDIKVTVCENTAVAAKLVSQSDRCDIASISAPDCARYYGLDVLEENVANSDSNFTRFICISKDMEIYPGADRVSLMLDLPHTPGALYSLIAKFAASGLNLTKLESRPIPGRDFEFSFYFDLEASVYSKDVLSILDELNTEMDKFTFLGSYTQV